MGIIGNPKLLKSDLMNFNISVYPDLPFKYSRVMDMKLTKSRILPKYGSFIKIIFLLIQFRQTQHLKYRKCSREHLSHYVYFLIAATMELKISELVPNQLYTHFRSLVIQFITGKE